MSEITPERVAAAVCEGDFGWIESLQAALSVRATGNVLNLEVARWDGPQDSEIVRHFRAVVVEGQTAPIVLDRATFEQRVNERFDNAIRKLGYESLTFMPATIAALREQILSLDVDLAESAQAEQERQP